LCEALHAARITYCHWKSNWRLNDWARGQGDLDLLVARSDVQRFQTILSNLGFKQALLTGDKQVPGIENFYGFDTEAGSFVHVHAHYQLVLGHDLTKNYHLPLEAPFLQSTVRRGLFQVPAPEFELIVFVIRMILKFSISESLLKRKRRISASALKKELEFLEMQVDAAQVNALLELHLPFIDSSFFERCKSSLQSHWSIPRRFALGQQLRGRLRAHARVPRIVATLLTLERRMLELVHRMSGSPSRRKRLARGGALIALVGGDGAGKTTSVDALHRWLANKFDTRRIHLGKPPRSPVTWAVLVPLKAGQLLSRLLKGQRPIRVKQTDSSAFPGYLQLLHWVCAARDRHRLYVKARRFATNGGLVLCDRYPLVDVKLMDGANIARFLEQIPRNRFVNFLLKAETWYYQQIMPPDLLIILRLDPDIAVQRKVTEPPTHVWTRSREVWAIDWQGTNVRVIDASKPAEDVLARLQSLIWANL
jgi:thymidylate kinase